MIGTIERRYIKGGQVRAKKDGTPGIAGYSAVFNQQYDTGWMVETIVPGAFSRALSESQDVRCLFNHNPDNLLGRTKSGTLRLTQDDSGLHFDCDTDPNSHVASDVQAMIDRGDLDGCSFAFIVRKCTWREEMDATGNTTYFRDIEDVDLFDVGPVTYPAYEGTSVGLRSLWPDGVPTEVRSHVPALRQESKVERDDEDDCTCECQPCQDGDCSGCDCDGDDCDSCSNGDCRCGGGERQRMKMRLRLAAAA